jgi:AcrR family transcriptional regulator
MPTTGSRRPQQQERRRVILQAAAEAFFEQGYAATSIDAIIEKVGGSKRNIYSLFGSKEGLFTALVSENADQVLGPFEEVEERGRDLEENLQNFGTRLLRVYMSPTVIGIFRLVVGEISRFPSLANAFYGIGPGRAAILLAGILDRAAESERISHGDYSLAAGQFIGMLRGNLYLEIVLGMRAPLDPAEIEVAVRSCVSLFLNGIRRG